MRPVMRGYEALSGAADARRRLKILRGRFLDRRFERSSPIPALESTELEAVHSQEVMLPPRRYVEMEGGQTIEGLIFLASLVRALRPDVAFEIGTFKGVTTWTLARNMAAGVVHTLDLPPGEEPSLEVERTDSEIRELAGVPVYDRLPHAVPIEQHWGDSATFDFSSWTGSCDIVYVDGAHSEPYVLSDTNNAFEMLSDRGAIVWDDYWRHVEGVPRVLHAMAAQGLRRIPGTRLVVFFQAGAPPLP